MSDEKKVEDQEPTLQIGEFEVEVWIYDLYVQESAKLLGVMRSGLSSVDREISKEIVRAFHTFGSTTRTLGIPPVASLAYAMEALLDCFVERLSAAPDFEIPEDVKNLIRSGCDAMELQVQRIQAKEAIADFSDLIAKIEQTTEQWSHNMTTIEDGIMTTPSTVISDGWMDSASSDPFSSGGDDWLSSMEALTAETEAAIVSAKHENIMEEPIEETTPVVEEKPTVVVPKSKPVTEIVEIAAPVVISGGISFSSLPEKIAFLVVSEDLQDDIDLDILPMFLDESVELFPELVSLVESWKLDGGNPNSESCKLLKRSLHTLKGSSRMAGCMRFGGFVHNMEHLVEVGHAGVSQSEIPELLSIACDVASQVLEGIGKSAGSSVVVDVSNVAGESKASTKKSANATVTPSGSSQSLRVPIERMDKMSSSLAQAGMLHQRMVTDVSKMEQSLSDMTESLERLHRLVSEIEIQAEVQMQARVAVAGDNFDPLEFDRFTRLQELTRMVAENMHDISMVQQQLDRHLMSMSDSIDEQNLVEDDLRYEVMASRMLPVSSLESRLSRTVRQACRDAGKHAILHIDGASEIDSGVLSKVVPPLEHLLRNAVAHGIENKEQRVAQGKAEVGTIVLSVKQIGNEIRFNLKDDGAGIDRYKVSKKAAESGLIAEDEILPQQRANEMIFASGFSTADAVSQLSGRGVGLDVVKGEIMGMGGWLHVESVPSQGTEFSITVPSYMALMSTVPVEVLEDQYGIPSTLVKDVQVVPRDVLEFGYTTGTLVLADHDCPLYSLQQLVHGKGIPELSRNNIVMILEENGERVAIHVESINPDVSLVVRPLCSAVSSIPGIVGSSISGEGLPFLILNPIRMKKPETLELHEFSTTASTGTVVAKAQQKRINDILVMVVDDSMTVRRVSEKFLTREGFRVVTAKDGMDALEVLQGINPDIFLLDIEMPRMDGFELATTLRNTDATKHTPIVMISSRMVEKHQDHAFSLGVNAFLGKPYQEQQLLDEIQKWTGHVPKSELV